MLIMLSLQTPHIMLIWLLLIQFWRHGQFDQLLRIRLFALGLFGILGMLLPVTYIFLGGSAHLVVIYLMVLFGILLFGHHRYGKVIRVYLGGGLMIGVIGLCSAPIHVYFAALLVVCMFFNCSLYGVLMRQNQILLSGGTLGSFCPGMSLLRSGLNTGIKEALLLTGMIVVDGLLRGGGHSVIMTFSVLGSWFLLMFIDVVYGCVHTALPSLVRWVVFLAMFVYLCVLGWFIHG